VVNMVDLFSSRIDSESRCHGFRKNDLCIEDNDAQRMH
jgi:hypothetical protein